MGYNTFSPSADPVIAYVNGGGGGPLWASRPSTYGFQCGQNPQLLVTGVQSVTAEILAPATVTPDRSTVVTGDTVTFTVSVPWTSTFVVNGGWSWVADSAGANPTVVSGCGMHDTNCSYRIFGDGHAIAHTVHAENAVDLTGTSPTVHVAPAHLSVTANPSVVASGALATFTAHRSDGHAVPVTSWVWSPGSVSPIGPLAVGCAGGDSTCVTPMQSTDTSASQTGTMTAWAVLGTATESASVAITVTAEPPDTGGGCGLRAAATRSATVLASVQPTKPVVKSNSVVRTGGSLKLDCGGGGGGSAPGMALTVDHDTTTPLYPHIRPDVVNGVDTVAERKPDTANVSIALTLGGVAIAARTQVTVRGEFLPSTGGHAHVVSALPFQFAPTLTQGSDVGHPVTGYFFAGGQVHPDVAGTTDSTGTVHVKLVAGYMGGRARIIASAYVGDSVMRDTAFVAFGVPDLTDATGVVTGVYWIGNTQAHPQSYTHFVQNWVPTSLQTIATNMDTTIGGTAMYLQYNDATLVQGGTFTVTPANEPGQLENPYGPGHQAHDTGLDIDIALCYADAQGDGSDGSHRVSGQLVGTVTSCWTYVHGATLSGRAVSVSRMQEVVDNLGAAFGIHFPSDQTHFHIRF
jgi:hypothetical protein